MHVVLRLAKRIGPVTFLFLIFLFPKAYGNVNAIDFTKVNYPKQLQQKIDFLKDNDGIYNHWVHTWSAQIPKTTVVENLASLYTELQKVASKNVETELLLGDIAHYLYNLETEEYYQKAIDHYQLAQALAPTDYRVYWFLANHYALSAKQTLSIQIYQTALQYLPKPSPHSLFWADYSVACANAEMYGASAYAARQTSKLQGQESYVEGQISAIIKSTLKSPPADSTINAKDMWSFSGKQDDHLTFTNWVLGTRITVDSTWNLDLGAFSNHVAHMTFTPNKATAKNGQKIGYSILILANEPKVNESLQQYMDRFTGKYKNRRPANLTVGSFKNIISYEIKDPEMYQQIGGGHMYAIAFESTGPDFPGMALEAPVEIPKKGEKGKGVRYYKTNRHFSRLTGSLYYFILLDSCEFIHDESFTVFKDFLKNGVTIE